MATEKNIFPVRFSVGLSSGPKKEVLIQDSGVNSFRICFQEKPTAADLIDLQTQIKSNDHLKTAISKRDTWLEFQNTALEIGKFLEYTEARLVSRLEGLDAPESIPILMNPFAPQEHPLRSGNRVTISGTEGMQAGSGYLPTSASLRFAEKPNFADLTEARQKYLARDVHNEAMLQVSWFEGRKETNPSSYPDLYHALNPFPITYGFDLASEENGQQQQRLVQVLLRRYEPSLLLVALNADQYGLQDQQSKQIEHLLHLLRSASASFDVIALQAIATDLNSKAIDFISFPDSVRDPTVADTNESDEKKPLKEFFHKLQTIFSKREQSTQGIDANRTDSDLLRNPAIEKLMNTDSYKDLIERIAKIGKRKTKDSPNYEKDLLKMKGILEIEEAFQQALSENDKNAFKIIEQAIDKHKINVSAYSGCYSEEFFSFWTGYKSTSHGLLNQISKSMEQAKPAANSSQDNDEQILSL